MDSTITIIIAYEHGRGVWVLNMYGKRYVFDTLGELWRFAYPEIQSLSDR